MKIEETCGCGASTKLDSADKPALREWRELHEHCRQAAALAALRRPSERQQSDSFKGPIWIDPRVYSPEYPYITTRLSNNTKTGEK